MSGRALERYPNGDTKGDMRMGKLTLEFVNTVKEPGRHPDGNGLFLKVRDAGSKQWIWRGTGPAPLSRTVSFWG